MDLEAKLNAIKKKKESLSVFDDYRFKELEQMGLAYYIQNECNRIESYLNDYERFIAFIEGLEYPESRLIDVEPLKVKQIGKLSDEKNSFLYNVGNHMVSYLNDNLGLRVKIDNRHFEKFAGEEGLALFLKLYYSFGNIKSASDGGLKLLKEDLLDLLNLQEKEYRNPPVLKKNTFKYDSWAYFDSYWNTNPDYNKLDWGSEWKIQKLFRGIFTYERDHFVKEANCSPFFMESERHIMKGKYEFPRHKKIKAIQIYNNGSLKLTFASEEELKMFIHWLKN